VIEERCEANGLSFRILQQGAGGRLALCLHGFPECAHSWRHQLPLLAELGYRAWAPDLRGYGGSDTPAAREDYALEKLLADVDGLIAAAGAHGRVTLLAHDWGAIIAWYYAMRRPSALERLVIMNVPHPACALEQLHLSQLARSWYMAFFQLPRLPEWLLERRGPSWPVEALRRTAVHPERFDDATMTHFEANASRPGATTAMFNYYRAALAGGGFARQRRLGYPQIRVPTLMLWGEQDLALSKRLSFGTARWVPDLVQRYLPSASHFVQQDQPEVVNSMLEAWLQDRPVPHAEGATADYR
jgi:pimeloyl-ACP methyl ester carboxylesterase